VVAITAIYGRGEIVIPRPSAMPAVSVEGAAHVPAAPVPNTASVAVAPALAENVVVAQATRA
jgi:hypothetical protein